MARPWTRPRAVPRLGTAPHSHSRSPDMRHRRLPLAALIVTVCAASFTGCNCGSTRAVAPPLPPLSAVILTPPTDTLTVGDVKQFVASALDTNHVAVAG